MTTAIRERPSRRWTLVALAGSLAALLPWATGATPAGADAAGSATTGSESRPRPTSTTRRGRWEYALYDLQTYKATRYTAFFNELGNAGWELVGMSAYTPLGSRDGEHVLATFKRPK